MQVLRGRSLAKSFRKKRVVDDVSLEVREGEVVGLLGPNGAGKTTTFHVVVGLTRPDSGNVFLNDQEITALPMYLRARSGISYLPQEPSIFRKLTVEENALAILETLPLPRGGETTAPGRSAGGVGTCGQGAVSRLYAFRRGTEARGDYPGPRHVTFFHAPGRALRRNRSDRGRRHPKNRSPSEGEGNRDSGHGPQRSRNSQDYRSSLYNE